MNTILKYVFYIVVLFIIYLIGRSFFAREIDDTTTIGQTIDQVQDKAVNLASNMSHETGQAFDNIKQNVNKSVVLADGSNQVDYNLEKGDTTMSDDGKGVWDKTKEVSSDAWDATKEGTAKAWDKTKEVSSDAWDATKEGAAKASDAIAEKSSDAWEATKEGTSKAWDKTKEVSSNAWNATKEGTEDAGDAVADTSEDAWEATKDAAHSASDAVSSDNASENTSAY